MYVAYLPWDKSHSNIIRNSDNIEIELDEQKTPSSHIIKYYFTWRLNFTVNGPKMFITRGAL